ncbi:MAG: hypothetical protein R3A44_30945 [Caldilineaceae bacterium]
MLIGLELVNPVEQCFHFGIWACLFAAALHPAAFQCVGFRAETPQVEQ